MMPAAAADTAPPTQSGRGLAGGLPWLWSFCCELFTVGRRQAARPRRRVALNLLRFSGERNKGLTASGLAPRYR